MHVTQQKLLKLASERDLSKMKLMEVGRLVGVDHPQVVKYHMAQLHKRNLIAHGFGGTVNQVERLGSMDLIAIPIYGAVNAGPATLIAEDRLEGYLRVSSNLLGRTGKFDSLLALKVVGSSMDRAHIGPNCVPAKDGDYVIVDKDRVSPKTGDYVVSIIDGMANVKRFRDDAHKIYLESESSKDLPPIVLHKDDSLDFVLAGEVIQVI